MIATGSPSSRWLSAFPGTTPRGLICRPRQSVQGHGARPVLDHLPNIRLTLLIGGYAQKWHLKTKTGVTDTVAAWKDHAPSAIPLPHPSWRNSGWIRKNPWFERDLLPVLRQSVKDALA